MAADPNTPRARGDSDAPHMSPITPSEDLRTIMINNISWGAVFAGVFMALVTQMLLNMLGLGIGAATLDPQGGDQPSAASLSLGAAIWWSVAGIIAAFIGGHTAGRLCGRPKESTAGWHGLTSWAMTTVIIGIVFTTAIGTMVGGTLSAIGGVARTAVQTTGQAAGPLAAQAIDPFRGVELDLRAATGGNDPAALRDASVAAVRAVLTGDQARAEEARSRAASILARSQGTSEEQARTQIAAYEEQYRQAVTTARDRAAEAAEATRRAVSQAALVSFIALVLGALAAYFGGRAGTIAPTATQGLSYTPPWAGAERH